MALKYARTFLKNSIEDTTPFLKYVFALTAQKVAMTIAHQISIFKIKKNKLGSYLYLKLLILVK